ncbi:uncharacterized protein LOC116413609 [Galleria mellonella]|uniref:Uncharacterized protein LOC116413609 n=1 Tax=Galleria mellonella TaxID=7137 RepID=A0ABM3MKH3_GALME|nr:uncharacterized protein LOC116413609 [Galleria mellonella]
MDNRKFEVTEDLLDVTDSEGSTSSSSNVIFEPHQPFVLDLHDLQIDAPRKDDPPYPPPEVKKKQRKKKKGQSGPNKSHTSISSSSLSEANSVPSSLIDEHAKETFYDAHESYHALLENQASNPVATAVLLQARSEHGPDFKITLEQAAPTQAASTTKQLSTISKLVTRPD